MTSCLVVNTKEECFHTELKPCIAHCTINFWQAFHLFAYCRGVKKICGCGPPNREKDNDFLAETSCTILTVYSELWVGIPFICVLQRWGSVNKFMAAGPSNRERENDFLAETSCTILTVYSEFWVGIPCICVLQRWGSVNKFMAAGPPNWEKSEIFN